MCESKNCIACPSHCILLHLKTLTLQNLFPPNCPFENVFNSSSQKSEHSLHNAIVCTGILNNAGCYIIVKILNAIPRIVTVSSSYKAIQLSKFMDCTPHLTFPWNTFCNFLPSVSICSFWILC